MDSRAKKRLEELYSDLKGYKLNPDQDFVADLAEGLIANNDRYGIETCPCRLYEGEKQDNYDIICPCDYRDDDLAEYGACFCALYVTDNYDYKPVPDRRPQLEERRVAKKDNIANNNLTSFFELKYPVYRCSVCGYLMANNHPPAKCPICKVGKERFERFI